jgi:hypothetical protein
MIFALVALTARLAVDEKAMSEEKVAVDEKVMSEEKATQSVVEAAQQIAELSVQASEEAKAALMQDLQFVQTSPTATTKN